MKSRILSLLVAMALILSLAVPAFAQTGETSEDNDLYDVTDVADQEETDEDLPEETEEDEDDPAEPSGSEDNNNIPQNDIVNVASGSSEDAEGNGQEEESGSEDNDAEEGETESGDNGTSEEDDSDEELNSEDGESGEDNASEDGEIESEEEDKSGEDGESETDGNESEEDDEAEEDNVSEDDENDSEEDAESEDGESGNDKDNSEEDESAEDDPEKDDEQEDGEDESAEGENESGEDISSEDGENESGESEDNSEDDESTEDADVADGFRLLTTAVLEDVDLEGAEVVTVNSVVFMAAGAAKSEPIMAAPKSAPVQSGTCGENLTWTLDDEGVLTISGTGTMDDYLGQYVVGNKPWSSAGQITKLVLNEGITSIGGGAFYNLYEVSEVTIPRSVVSIGKSAFSGANGITTIRFEHTASDPLTIGQYAFYYYYGHTYDMTEHPTLSTTVIVPDKNNINPAISGYSWTEDVRTVTFKSASDSGSQGATTTNNIQPVYYNYSSPLEMIENWEKRNTFYDIVLETVLKNKTDKDEKYNLHNIAAAVYNAADINNAIDIIGTEFDLLLNNNVSTRELEKQDELMLKLLKENFSMYLADDRLLEQQQQEAKMKEILSKVATAGGMAQLGFSQYNVQVSRTASGIMQLALGSVEIYCDTVTDIYNICVMQANYERAIEYLDRLQSSVDRNTSLYRACDMMREDINSNWPLGPLTKRQAQKDVENEGKLVISILSNQAIRTGYQWAYSTKTLTDITSSVGKIRGFTGDFCSALMGWQMGSLVGKLLTKSTGDALQDEEDLLRLYIASTEIKQAMANSDDEDALYDLSSLYLTAREAGLETSCKYFVDTGYAREETNAIIDTVHTLRHSSPVYFALDGLFTVAREIAASQEPEAEGPYPETQEFYDMLYAEGCKLDEIRDAMGLPTYERNPQKPDKIGRVIEKVYGAAVIWNTFESAAHYDNIYNNSLRLTVEDGKVDGKIPLEKYAEIRKTSVHNPDADTLTLGKYGGGPEDPKSYVTIAEKNGNTYFSMTNEEWYGIEKEYGLTDKDMFRIFNEGALDDAVISGKTICFTSNPSNDAASLGDEWDYLQNHWGYTTLIEKDGYWYAK